MASALRVDIGFSLMVRSCRRTELNGRSTCCSARPSAYTCPRPRADSYSALFIEPKWAQFLQSSGVTEALGRPMPQPFKSPAALDGATERII